MSTQEPRSSAADRRTFLAGAGAAGLAAGAAVLGSPSAAGASAPAATEVDLDLKWADLSSFPWSLDDVDLGSGDRFAKGQFVAMGEMAALSIRIKVGTSADLGSGPWCLDGNDFPAGFVPVEPPNDLTPAGTTAWAGTGQVVDPSDVNKNTYALGAGIGNFTNVGAGTLLVWAMWDKNNNGGGDVLFNFGGAVPFGHPLSPGSTLFTSLVYQRDTSSD